ncbi:ICAM4 protein, partial [Nycticryphes semicollaris]|nr:ICAM4 protein [Nycticryphes semicollaris]
LLNVTEWYSTVIGYYSCFQERKKVPTKLTVYRAPQLVVLEPVPALEVKKSWELKCRVAGAAPVRHLVVTLQQGDGKVLSTKTFPEIRQDEPEDVEMTHMLTAERWDHG